MKISLLPGKAVFFSDFFDKHRIRFAFSDNTTDTITGATHKKINCVAFQPRICYNKIMKEEKVTKTSTLFNDVFVAVGVIIACFGIISVFAVGSFGAICSVVGVFRSFTAERIAVSLVLSVCGLFTAILMFYLGFLVSRVFLDGISDYIVSRKKKLAVSKKD